MPITLIPAADLAISLWRNQAGRKADIAATPDWLIGYAWLDADAPFSDYAGWDRTITLVEGPGFALDFAPSNHAPSTLTVDTKFIPAPFNGGWPTLCRLLGTPCRVLNVMTARAAYTHTVTILTAPALTAHTPTPAGPDHLVLLQGHLTASVAHQTVQATPFDAIRLHAPTALRATPDAIAALIRIAAVQQRTEKLQ